MNGLLEITQGSIEFFRVSTSASPIAVDLGQPWGEGHRAVEVLEGAFQVPLFFSSVATVAVSPCLSRIERDRPVEISNRAVEFARGIPGDTSVYVTFNKTRLEQ